MNQYIKFVAYVDADHQTDKKSDHDKCACNTEFKLTTEQASLSHYLSHDIPSYDEVKEQDATICEALRPLERRQLLPTVIISVIVQHASTLPCIDKAYADFETLNEIVKYLEYHDGRSCLLPAFSQNINEDIRTSQRDELWDTEYLVHLGNENMLEKVADAASDDKLGIRCLYVKVQGWLGITYWRNESTDDN